MMGLLILTSLASCKGENKEGQTDNTIMETTDTEAATAESESVALATLAFNDPAVKAQFDHYIHLKTALVNSDVEESRLAASQLMESTAQTELKELLSEIATTEDIEVQRTAFSSVTEKMTGLVEAAISSGEVYKQFCPMAFNNTGGYWLSTEKEIRNPYFGDQMLTCGMVKETIN